MFRNDTIIGKVTTSAALAMVLLVSSTTLQAQNRQNHKDHQKSGAPDRGKRTAPPTRPGGREVVKRMPSHGGPAHFRPGHDSPRGGDTHVVRSHGPAVARGRVVLHRPNHTVVVANRFGHGYVQRPFMVRNTAFVHRSYFVHGVSYAHVYRPFVFRGVSLEVYAPSRYYAPAFYGWAYSPWVAPVHYRWSWAGRPWVGYYGGYFRPYPVYTSPSLWLTDYLVASTLEQAYQARANSAAVAAVPSNGPVALTPEVKQAIAEEVKRQVALESAERQAVAQNSMPDPATSGIAQMLGDKTPHVFVASSSLTVLSGGQECSISEGAVLQLKGTPQANASTADLQVLASQGQDCRKGSVVSVAIQDLQEMQNNMRQTLDRGLGELQSHQGGLPTPPASALAAPTQSSFAAAAPPVDPNAATELKQAGQTVQ